MSKNLNVNLSFTANTAQAKAQIKSLQDSLNSLSMNHVGDINIDDKLRKASAEAAQLKAHLAAATNMKTGTLDFTKLNRSLKDSGVSLQHYGETLRAMGPEGQRAFSQLARAVAQSEVPIRRTNKLVKEMSVTLKNSLRWQLSSSILHGFMTSMSDAYNYAKNLNSALTDIRIVSGQSADQMARFAKQANIAAKDLSTTTQEYAKAALIYYQQGLKQQEVTERTEVTVKMANVTGDAAQDVSSYMTAIWNNFNKAGDESVEHFADIMTKLGAATAASTSEIAAGLSKFSAVADTIGLSFEMATSAVTAIVDQTRETPEVVGTALKTIFSRIEGLQQGETMEDGVNLNKYSKGLQKVGVDIMDTNGKLKDADQILKEIGDKWETLDKNQQVALAQTTAGVRQYNQFMALFDNWDKVEQNLTLAATAEGTLDQQAEIYAESWEAASNRVRASLEGLFDSLLEDDFFIGLLNGFSELIGFIEGTVDALGGMKGVLLAIGAILTKVFSKQMAGGLRNMGENIQMMTPKGRQKVIDQKREQLEALSNARHDENAGYGDREGASREKSIKASIGLQDKFIQNESRMNDIEKDTVRALIDKHDSYSDKAAESAREADEAKAVQDATRDRLRDEIIDSSINNGEIDYEEIKRREQKLNDAMNKVNSDAQSKLKVQDILNDIDQKGEFTQEHLDGLSKAVNDIDPSGISNLTEMLPDISRGAEDAKIAIKAMGKELESVAQINAEEAFKEVEDDEENIKKIVSDADERASKEKKSEEDEQQRQKVEGEVHDQIDNAQGVKATAADGIIAITNAIANASMMISIFDGAIRTLTDPNVSGWDKFLAILGALAAAIPIVTSSFTMLTSAQTKAGLSAIRNSIALAAQNAASKKGAAGVQEHTEELNENSVALGTNTGLLAANNAEREGDNPDIDIDGKSKKKGFKGKIGGLLGETGALGKDIFTIVKSHPALIAVSATIAALGVMIWGVHRARTADNRAAEEAVKIAQDASAAHDLVISKMDEMQSHLDTYEQVSDSLKDITKGTQEWYNALNDSNQAVLSLIDQFPKLAEYVENIDGRLIISQEGQDWLTEESQNQLNASQNTLMYANSQKMETSLEAKKSDLRQDIQQDINLRTPGQDVEFSNEIMTKAINAINTQGSGFLLDPGSIQEVLGVSAQVAEALYENSSELITLAGEVSANTAAQEIYSEQIAESHLADSELYKNASDFEQDIINGLAGAELDRKTDELYEEKYKNGAGLTDKEAQEQYAELIGADDFKNKRGNKGEYLINGQWETIPDEVARLALAANEAGNSLEGFAEKVLETINNILSNAENADLDIDSEVAEVMMGFNGETGDVGDVSQLSKEQLDTLGNIQFTDSDAQNLGYNSAAELMRIIDDSIAAELGKREAENIEQAENAVVSIDNAVVDRYKNDSNWTAQNTLNFNKAGGSEGLIESYGGEEALASYATEQGVSVDDILANIDWSQIPSEDVSEWFKEAVEQGAEDAKVADEIEANYSEDAQEFGFDEQTYRDLTETLQESAEASEELDDGLKSNEKAAQEMAKDILRYDKALESVNEHSDEWLKTLESGDLVGQTEIMDDLAEAYGNMLDLDGSSLSDDFLTNAENLRLMQEAANGSEEAYNQLMANAQQDIMTKVGIDKSDWDADFQSLMDEYYQGQNLEDLEAGASLNNEDFLAGLSEMVNAAGLTADQATDLLSSMGIDAEVEDNPTYIPETSTVVSGYQPTLTWGDGSFNIGPAEFNYKIPQLSFKTLKETVTTGKDIAAPSLKVTSASKSSGGGFKHKSGGGKKGGTGGGSGGGGGGKSTPIKKSPKSSKQKRYEQVTNELQDLARAQRNAADEADRLYGKDRLKKMDEVSKKIKEQIKLLEETKMAEAKAYKQQDQNDLTTYIEFLQGIYGSDPKAGGIASLIFDEEGNVSNIEDAINFLGDKIQAIEDSYKNEAIISESDEEKLDLLEERKSLLESYYEAYKESDEVLEEIEDEKEAFERELQDIAFENFNYELELKIELNDKELEKLEYFFNKTQRDNIYDMAEGLQLLWDGLSGDGSDGKVNLLMNEIDILTSSLNDLYSQNISDADFKEKRNEIISNLIAAAEELQDVYDQVTHEYYVDAMEMTLEEIDKYAEGFDNLTSVIEHYQNIAGILGKETDYEYMEKFLNGTVAVIDNKLKVSKEKYQLLQDQQRYWEEQLANTTDEDERKAIQKNLDEVNIMVAEAQDEMLSTLEEKTEAMRAVVENKMAQISKTLEDTFTGGAGFDSFMSEFEKLNSRQEEYLTKTNQIYETNKLMRQAAQAADKTDNEVAKRKLKNFEDETKSLQQNTKLSNYELEIQQAKYDLLLAEIALEEAQNAKSTVRLQRDNEGNFGYVYTANKDDIADAQQKYEDAQNALYNISLQGQQDYTAKYLESLQMMQEELAELDEKWLNGEIDSIEEYNRQRDAITDHYFNPETGVLATYSKLYNVAVQADTNATEDYWGKSYGNMTKETEKWKTAVDEYIEDIDKTFEKWAEDQKTINTDLTAGFDSIDTAIEDVVTESVNLEDSITNKVIPALGEEIDGVAALTLEYIKLTNAIKEKIALGETGITDNAPNWQEYGKDFDFLREAIRQSQGMGTTDLTVDQALTLRKQKILSDPDEYGYDTSKYSEEEISHMIDLEHAEIQNALLRGAADTGWSPYTQTYLQELAVNTDKVYDRQDIIDNYTDFAFDMLMLSGGEKYKKYASFKTYEDAVTSRRKKTGNVWADLSLESLFIREKYEPKLAQYLEKLRTDFDADNSKYPGIKIAEAGIATDLGTAIKQYANGDASGYITNDNEMIQALKSRQAVYDKFKDYVPADGFKPNEELGVDLSKWLDKFDTGGYTGSWGPEGKLAMLHQKELILNASDTENMLKMIEIVRDLSQQIDMFAASQALRGALFSSPSYLTGQNGTLEQNVHIEASFPGVTDRNQIEEAFGNLVNIAYQHANKR